MNSRPGGTLLTAIVILLADFALGQEASVKPSFEVVSVRPGTGDDGSLGGFQGGPGSSDPGRFTARGLPLQTLMQLAFHVKSYQISAPDWIVRAYYDVDAKIPPGATEAEFQLMLQSMLEGRFKLKFHHETRESRGYNLVVAAGGLKLKQSLPSVDDCTASAPPANRANCGSGPAGIARSSATTPGVIGEMLPRGGKRYIYARAAPIETLAGSLERYLPRVVDKTGLTGAFDFQLGFSAPDANLNDDDAGLPSVFTVLEKQLGLKLESARVPIDTVVIDQINPPSEN